MLGRATPAGLVAFLTTISTGWHSWAARDDVAFLFAVYAAFANGTVSLRNTHSPAAEADSLVLVNRHFTLKSKGVKNGAPWIVLMRKGE